LQRRSQRGEEQQEFGSSHVKYRLSTEGKVENHACKFMGGEGICPSGICEKSNLKKPEIKKY
jgi:hypothetical protein